jgi:DNA modification methylase
MINQILHGDNIELMKQLEDNSICAAILENKNYIGMELENDYYEIAKARENYFLNGGKL